MAEAEANEYAQAQRFAYLGLAQAFSMLGDEVVDGHVTGASTITEGTEVFSLIRESDLQPPQYLDSFFDTGRERQGHVESGQ